jgi:CrcB protein
MLGGSLGALSRYLLSVGIERWLKPEILPVGTIVVNLVGCFLIGLLAALFEVKNWGNGWLRMFLFAGFLGSFTTFSTYTFDTFLLLKTDQFVAAFLNMGLQVLFGLALAIAGWYSIYALKISG